jgi:hypothetical protein
MKTRSRRKDRFGVDVKQILSNLGERSSFMFNSPIVLPLHNETISVNILLNSLTS